jgi:outer membrane protein assembly factor BamE (lipoprotein component of BamABCDE complex)
MQRHTIVLISIFLCLFIIIVINTLGYRSNVINGVTSNKIKAIKLGMSLDDVLLILGKPYEIEALDGLHNLSCKKTNQD